MTRDDHTPEPTEPAPAEARARRGVLLLDIEPPMAALIGEWLALDGRPVLHDAALPDEVSVIVHELAFPRPAGALRLARLRERWPGVPVIVLSATLLPGVAPQGALAQQLGAAALLPSPVSREALRAALWRVQV